MTNTPGSWLGEATPIASRSSERRRPLLVRVRHASARDGCSADAGADAERSPVCARTQQHFRFAVAHCCLRQPLNFNFNFTLNRCHICTSHYSTSICIALPTQHNTTPTQHTRLGDQLPTPAPAPASASTSASRRRARTSCAERRARQRFSRNAA